MGEIKKQGVSNSIIIIIGSVIGALNVMVLFPMILPEAYFGLTRVLVEATYIVLQFGLLGANAAIIRFWSRISVTNQLFRYVLKYSILCSVLVVVFMFIFKGVVVNYYHEKSPLIGVHYNALYVLFLAGLLFEFFAAASVGMLKTQFPTFLREIFIRIYVTILILVYYFEIIDETIFINLFVLGYLFMGGLIFSKVLKHRNILITTKTKLLSQDKRSINKYRIANFFSGFSSGIVNRLDVIMIAALVSGDLIANNGLKSVAVYSIALYTSTLIEIPSRGVFSISTPVIANFWANNEIKSITSVYKKSSINLLIVALLLFLLLSLNLDDLFTFLKGSYSAAKPVILILGGSKVFNMLLGVNNIILTTSKYYLVGTFTMVGLIALTFFLNYWLIPLYGINGAAFGSFASLIAYNLVSYLFLWYKFNIQPFSLNTVKALFFAFIAFYITSYININEAYISILSKTVAFSALYLIPIYFFKVSEDINEIVDKVVVRLFKK
jgi:O-antigen/teichoic acid export membrane protein